MKWAGASFAGMKPSAYDLNLHQTIWRRDGDGERERGFNQGSACRLRCGSSTLQMGCLDICSWSEKGNRIGVGSLLRLISDGHLMWISGFRGKAVAAVLVLLNGFNSMGKVQCSHCCCWMLCAWFVMPIMCSSHVFPGKNWLAFLCVFLVPF